MRKFAWITTLAVAGVCVMVGGGTASAGALLMASHQSDAKAAKVPLVLLRTQVAQTDETKAPETTTPSQMQTAPAPTPVYVTVADGDSLSSIAETHSTTWVRLYYANDTITDPNIINPGQQLRIPAADEQLPERPLPQSPAPALVRQSYSYTYSAPAAQPAPAASYTAPAGDAKAYIYSRESGNNPTATNPAGCYGLGQDCNGVLRAQCGADYACQDAYFDSYATRRYGSWDGALAFWQANGWW